MAGRVQPLMKKLVLAAVLAAGISGVAFADDSSMNPFTGESYKAFNSGDPSQSARADNEAAAWRQANPGGIAEGELQSYSAWGLAWKPTPVFASGPTDPTFRATHPKGLTESELQALSTDSVAWQSRAGATMVSPPGTVAAAQEQDTAPQSASTESFAHRLAHFFQVAPDKTQQ